LLLVLKLKSLKMKQKTYKKDLPDLIIAESGEQELELILEFLQVHNSC